MSDDIKRMTISEAFNKFMVLKSKLSSACSKVKVTHHAWYPSIPQAPPSPSSELLSVAGQRCIWNVHLRGSELAPYSAVAGARSRLPALSLAVVDGRAHTAFPLPCTANH